MRGAAWVILVLVGAVPAALATHQGPQDLNSVDLNVLLYHPLPDEKGDPWGVAAPGPANGTARDWIAARYGRVVYPTAVFDGIEVLEGTPGGEGGGAFQETRAAFEGILEQRLARDSPLSIHLDGDASASVLVAVASLAPDVALAGPRLEARVMLFEDDVPFNGGNGIVNHRFVVRAIHIAGDLDFSGGTAQEITATFPLAEDWSVGRLGVVVVVQNFFEDSQVFEYEEVLQSATWTTRQQGPTNQVVRGVLLELLSATWCPSCVYADTASDDLANEFGVQSTRVQVRAFEYLDPPPWLAIGVAASGAAGVTWLVARGPRRPEP